MAYDLIKVSSCSSCIICCSQFIVHRNVSHTKNLQEERPRDNCQLYSCKAVKKVVKLSEPILGIIKDKLISLQRQRTVLSQPVHCCCWMECPSFSRSGCSWLAGVGVQPVATASRTGSTRRTRSSEPAEFWVREACRQNHLSGRASDVRNLCDKSRGDRQACAHMSRPGNVE